MRSLWLIARREFAAYWTSPVAYVVIAVFLFITGMFFFGSLNGFAAASINSGGQGVDVNQQVVRPYLNSVSVILLFILPLVSMRLIAEEKRLGTLEIILTTPLRESSWVGGKYLASLGLFAVMLLVPASHVALLFVFGNPEWSQVLTGFLGLFLTGGAYLAIGLFLSSITQNQVVAAVVAFALFLGLWLAYSLGQMVSGVLATVLTTISFTGHFHNFARGILDSADVVFYLSLIVAGLFGAVQSVLSTRWKS